MSFTTESRSAKATTGTSTGRARAETVTRYTRTGGTAATTAYWARVSARSARLLLRAVVRRLGETVTLVGWLLIGVLVVGLVVGLVFGIVEATVAGATAGILLVVSAPFLLGGRDFGVTLDVGRDRVVAGDDIAASVRLVNESSKLSLPGVVDIPVGEGLVEANIPLLRGHAEHVEHLTIAAHRRGIIDVGPMTIARGDPIGILRRELSWDDVQRIYVHPVTTPVPSTSAGLIRDLEGTPSRKLTDADLSFHSVREYVVGDQQRHVHWKATAKTGTLMVRQYEESMHSRIALLLDLDEQEYGSDDEFELAVSVASSLGVQGIRDGRDVLVAASALLPEFTRSAVQSIVTIPSAEAKALLDGMCAIESSSRVMRLESVCRLTAQSFGDLSIVFLVTGAAFPLTRMRQSAILFEGDAPVVAVRCEPGAEPSVQSTRELTVLTVGALHDLKGLLARGVLG